MLSPKIELSWTWLPGTASLLSVPRWLPSKPSEMLPRHHTFSSLLPELASSGPLLKEVGGSGQRSFSDLELQESVLGTGSALPGPAITQIPLADIRELNEAKGRSTRMVTWIFLCLPSPPPPHSCHLDLQPYSSLHVQWTTQSPKLETLALSSINYFFLSATCIYSPRCTNSSSNSLQSITFHFVQLPLYLRPMMSSPALLQKLLSVLSTFNAFYSLSRYPTSHVIRSVEFPLQKLFRGPSPWTEWNTNSLTWDSGSFTTSLWPILLVLSFCLHPSLTPHILATSDLSQFPGFSRPKVLRWDLPHKALCCRPCWQTLPPLTFCRHPYH